MATALQTQLAKIAASATNSHDLKAQRQAHGESLLDEPAVASKQDFDTIFDRCSDAFEHLTGIDSRFAPFRHTLFGEQSKRQDRTQLTAAQNKTLDSLIENFLSLVSRRLHLQPALSAVEWLVRRFRVHHLNTSALLFAFLPYYAQPTFSTVFERLLLILPSRLPEAFRFLDLNRQELRERRNSSRADGKPVCLTSIPQIVHAATRNQTFFALFNEYTIASCRRGHEFEDLIKLWGQTISQALAGQLDVQGTRKEARQKKEEDVVRRILTILNDGLSLRGSRLMRVACYTILAILVSRVRLADRTIITLIDAVSEPFARSASSLEAEDLTCLIMLNSHLESAALPKSTCQILLRNSSLVRQLSEVSQMYDTQSFILQMFLHACKDTHKSPAKLDFITHVLGNTLIRGDVLAKAITALAIVLKDVNVPLETSTQPKLIEALQILSESPELSGSVQSALAEAGFREAHEASGLIEDADDDSEQGYMDVDEDSKFSSALALAEKQVVDSSPPTFLTSQSSATYDLLARTASTAGKSMSSWSQLSELRCFHVRSKESLFSSFLLRFSSSLVPAAAKAASLTQLTKYIHDHPSHDFQLFLPYILVCLGDASPLTRKAAATCLAKMHDAIKQNSSSHLVFGKDALHGEHSQIILDPGQSLSLHGLFARHIEEYRLDSRQVSRVLKNILAGPKTLKVHDREVVLRFLAAGVEATPLAYTRAQLLHMLTGVSAVGSTSVTNALLPFLRRETQQSKQLVGNTILDATTEENYWTALLGAISASSPDGLKLLREIIVDQSASGLLRKVAMARARKLWPLEKPKRQVDLAKALFRAVYEVQEDISHTLSEDAADILSAVELSAPALLAVLQMLASLADVFRDEARSTKRQRTINGHVGSNETGANVLQQWSFALELVKLAKSRYDIDLLAQLNKMLAELHSFAPQLGNQTNYVEATLLDCISGSIKDVPETARAHVKASLISVDIIIDIFQKSQSTQVQRSSLLLISTLANVLPDTIMHHIMPVFTKMGQSILKHGDEYSIHVADLAVKSIIPPLLSSFCKQKSGLQEGVVRVLLSFVVAYDHIPHERRLPLFTSLVEQLGADDALHLLLLLFVDKHGRSKGAEDFIAELFPKYEASTQLKALSKSIQIVHDACQEHPLSATHQIIPSKDRKVRFNTTANFLSLAIRVTQYGELQRNIESMLSRHDQQAASFRRLTSEVIERTLRLGASLETHNKLAASCSHLLDSLLRLTPVHETINGLESLLNGKDLNVQRQVLKSIEARVSTIRARDEQAQKACLDLLPQLETSLQDSKDSKLVQTMISCVDAIIERFGKKGAAQTTSIIKVMVSTGCLSSDDDNVKVLTFFCLATAFQTLGERLLPLLPQILRSSFEASARCIHDGNGAVFNAALAMHSAILDHLSQFVTKAQNEQLLRLCADAAVHDQLSEQSLENRHSTLELLGKRQDESESRDCMSALSATWDHATGCGVEAMLQHVRVLNGIVSVMPKKTASKLGSTFLTLFLQILGTSSQNSKETARYTVDDMEAVEELLSQTMVKVIYKLNDTSFRPMFLRMLEWAAEPSGAEQSVSRHAALYKFLHGFFETLKSIVTSYAGLVIDDASKMLQAVQTGGKFSHALWVRLVQTLRAAFEHDQDEYFQAPSRFNIICAPLVDQLARSKELGEDVKQQLVPCIVSFASAADSAENQKAVNQAVLAHLRSERPEVRLAAVECQRQLTEALSDEWLAHLPEMLPFIGEALEDDEEEVQNATRRWVSRIETIIGESLSPMLQ